LLGFTHKNNEQCPTHTHIVLHLSKLYLRFPRDDLIPDGCLHSDLKHLPRNGVLEALTHGFPHAVRPVPVRRTSEGRPVKKKKIHRPGTAALLHCPRHKWNSHCNIDRVQTHVEQWISRTLNQMSTTKDFVKSRSIRDSELSLSYGCYGH